jgi:hypothetical protein
LDPLKNGAIGRGLVSGVCPVAISTLGGLTEWADVDDDSTVGLRAAETGSAKILWIDSEYAGTHWAVVQLGGRGPASLWATLEDDLESGGQATAVIWDGYPLEETDRVVTVYDWLLAEGDSLAAGQRVKIEWISGKWYVTGARCA